MFWLSFVVPVFDATCRPSMTPLPTPLAVPLVQPSRSASVTLRATLTSRTCLQSADGTCSGLPLVSSTSRIAVGLQKLPSAAKAA